MERWAMEPREEERLVRSQRSGDVWRGDDTHMKQTTLAADTLHRHSTSVRSSGNSGSDMVINSSLYSTGRYLAGNCFTRAKR